MFENKNINLLYFDYLRVATDRFQIDTRRKKRHHACGRRRGAFSPLYREAASRWKISFATALCRSSKTLPCFSVSTFRSAAMPPNSIFYHATRNGSSPTSNSSIYHQASSVDFIRSASIAFSWHTVMKIYRGAYTERREMEGSSRWLIAVLQKFPRF